MQSLISVYKNWTFTFKIVLPNYPSRYGTGLSIQGHGFKSAGGFKIKVISAFHLAEIDQMSTRNSRRLSGKK